MILIEERRRINTLLLPIHLSSTPVRFFARTRLRPRLLPVNL